MRDYYSVLCGMLQIVIMRLRERKGMLVRVLAAAALLVSGIAASAQEATPAPAETVKEKKICRSVTATGTIMPKRVCMTKNEWAKASAAGERQKENYENARRAGAPNT